MTLDAGQGVARGIAAHALQLGVACGALKATQSVHLLELASTGLAGHNGVHDLYS